MSAELVCRFTGPEVWQQWVGGGVEVVAKMKVYLQQKLSIFDCFRRNKTHQDVGMSVAAVF